MNNKFDKFLPPSLVDNALALLRVGKPQKVNALLSEIPERSVFAIYLDKKLIHIGKSVSTAKYLRRICLESDAFLAFKLARKDTGKLNPTFRKGFGSKVALKADPVFADALRVAEIRLQDAEFRLVEVKDSRMRRVIHVIAEAMLECPPTSPH